MYTVICEVNSLNLELVIDKTAKIYWYLFEELTNKSYIITCFPTILLRNAVIDLLGVTDQFKNVTSRECDNTNDDKVNDASRIDALKVLLQYQASIISTTNNVRLSYLTLPLILTSTEVFYIIGYID